MSDELDALKSALKAAPAPEAEAKARALALAMKNFDTAQGSPMALRPMEDRPKEAGFLRGVKEMMSSIAKRRWLAASTSAAALAVGVAVFAPHADKGPLPKMVVVAEPEAAEAPKPDLGRAEQDRLVATDKAAGQQEPAGEAVMAQEAEAGIALDDTAMAGLTTRAAPPMTAAAGLDGTMTLSDDLEHAQPLPPSTEAFANAEVNPVKITAEEPVSTFSIDVDTASYAVVRSSLNAGQLPPPEAVRIEEMVNYFPYAYPAPDGTQAFRPTISVMPTPWNAGTRLVHIGIQGAMPAIADRPSLNLVFLIDTSGSMDEPNKLPLLKQSFAMMLEGLRATDQVAIVTYAGSAGTVLPPTNAGNRAEILSALDRLSAGGSTAGAEGIALAYDVAEGMTAQGEVSRVILATDGDFNVGMADPEALKVFIADRRESGTYLSVLGFGRGNLDDATMQALAQNGNGTASYIDTLNEARKVLVDQLVGALYPIANNVKIQVEWNPAEVAEYRLIGYETRALAREDFNNDKVDAGDIGAGTAVTAIYEITAPGSAALLNDPLRYQSGAAQTAGNGELGFLRIRQVAPGQSESVLQETAIGEGAAATPEAQFAVAIAGFGQLLSGAKYTGDWGWDQAIEMALAARGTDDFGYRIEAVNLMRMAQSLSAQP